VQVVIEFPYVFAQAMIYSTIFYSMGSFVWTVDRFIWYLFFMYFTMLYFTFYGMMTTAVTPNHHVAAIIAAPCYMLWNLFSGFMIPHKVWKLMLYCLHFQFQLLSTLKESLLQKVIEYEICIHIPNYLSSRDFIFFLKFTENTYLVEMVLLGKPCSLDFVWSLNFTVWR
jgi:hypothetical protein